MTKSANRVNRGMVFWFDLAAYIPTRNYKNYPEGKSIPSHLQFNNRPWLVVSIDINNVNSPMYNIVPITSEPKPNLPCHVSFRYNNMQQTVLCESIMSVDAMALKDYMCTLSDDLMIEVERAMASQYGIRPSVTYMDLKLSNVVDHLQSVIDKLIKEKVQAIQTSEEIPLNQIEDAAVSLGTTLEKLLTEPQKPQIEDSSQPNEDIKPKGKTLVKNSTSLPAQTSGQNKYSGMSPVEKFNAKYGLSKKVVSDQPVKSDKPKRNTWTTENRKQYLKDCETLSPQEVMKKYNLGSLNSVFQTKYSCKNALDKLKSN